MYHLIYNTYASRGNSRNILDEFIKILQNGKYEFTLYETQRPGHATEITKKIIQEGAKYIIMIGGDGTIYEILNGYSLGDDVVFGLIPAGTGNDFARMLSIPTKVTEAAKIIFDGYHQPVDFLRINEKTHSALFSSYGIAAEMVLMMTTFQTRNKFSYTKSLLRKAWGHTASQYKITHNNEEKIYTADFCGVHNGMWAGAGMKLIPNSLYNDGLSEFLVVEYKGKFRRICNLLAVMRKKLHKQPNVTIYPIKSILIQSMGDDLCCIDGEATSKKSLFIENIGSGINFLKKI